MNLPRDFKRILLIRRKALGDALVSMRAVLEVTEAWPAARVDLVIDKPFASLVAELLLRTPVRERVKVLVWPPTDGGSWLGRLRSADYDLVIDWLGSPRTAGWTLLTGAAVRVGYDLPRRRWVYNVKVPRNRAGQRNLRGFAGEAFLDPLRCLGLEPRPWRDGFADMVATDATVGALGDRFRSWLEQWGRQGPGVVMMMSATWSAKAWPCGHAVSLFRELEARGRNPIIVTGPGDRSLETELRRDLPGTAIAPPTNLLELARLLAEARLFVGTDCGPRHLAASLGVPTVTLFGPTDPVGWNPADPSHVSVRTGEECSPCDLADCPVPGHPCMTDLSPEMAARAVERVLARQAVGKVVS
mgnify:FL=1